MLLFETEVLQCDNDDLPVILIYKFLLNYVILNPKL